MTATPKSLGYHFPAEFEKHDATWLSWPHKEASWPGKIESIFPAYSHFVKCVAAVEKVRINVGDASLQAKATHQLEQAGVPMDQIEFFLNPTNDAWCRDHGPAFLVNRKEKKKAIVDWGYNAWGGKYPPFDLDDVIPTRIAGQLGLPVFAPGPIMEGGSVDFNGAGTVLTTTSCLCNVNRNPYLSVEEIEYFLTSFYGVDQVLWLGDGIVGDDTDGHIDDITRFVNKNTVITVVEEDKQDDNYEPLQANLKALKGMRLLDGQQLNIIEIPMPAPVVYEDQRLPASYANFYIANCRVIVPTFRDKNDHRALSLIQQAFPGHEVIGIDSLDIIWGLGSFHCLSQQEPTV